MILHIEGCYSPYYKGTQDLIERLRELIRTGWVQADNIEVQEAVGDALTWLEQHPGPDW